MVHNESGEEVAAHFLRGKALRAVTVGVLPAWLVGVAVMRAHQAPMGMVLVNTAAVLVGVAVLLTLGGPLLRALARRPGSVGLVVVAVLASTLAFEPLDGVHRWVTLGPVRLQPSAMLGPLALSSIAVLVRARRSVVAAVVLMAGIEAVHVVQPDAGQATALAVGMVVLAARAEGGWAVRALGVGVAVVGAAAAWSRPDPLGVVPLVEDALPRAFAWSVAGGIAAVAAVAALPGAALVGVRARAGVLGASGALALAGYFAAAVGVTLVGCFPTPVLGYGASPIVGAIVGLAVLGGASGGSSPNGLTARAEA